MCLLAKNRLLTNIRPMAGVDGAVVSHCKCVMVCACPGGIVTEAFPFLTFS